MEPLSEVDVPQPSSWMVIRDAGVFQIKLLVDGFRDLMLVPASFVAACISLIRRNDGRPGSHFYRVVSLGHQSERWINLFGALRNAPPGVADRDSFGSTDIDDLVARVESFVVNEYRRGGVTAQAKRRIDDALAAMRASNKQE